MEYPIYRLSQNVSETFAKYRSMPIDTSICEGLCPEIEYIDKEGKIDNSAILTQTNKVRISAAYCQFIWMLCYATYIKVESDIVYTEYDHLSEAEKIQFISELQQDTAENNFLRFLWDKESVYKKSFEAITIAFRLFDSQCTEKDMERIRSFSFTDSIDSCIVNGIYQYAISFILLHEYGHFVLEHPINSTKDHENEADSSAYWTMLNDLEGKEKTTAILGIIASFCSMLFFDGSPKGDEQHPDTDERLFTFLDFVKDEDERFEYFTFVLLIHWAFKFNKSDFPSLTDYERGKSIDLAKEYLSRMKNDEL